jgi:hypothetical protein
MFRTSNRSSPEQRILSPGCGRLPYSTMHYQAVFSRQSKSGLAWYEHVTPSSSPHPEAQKGSREKIPVTKDSMLGNKLFG